VFRAARTNHPFQTVSAGVYHGRGNEQRAGGGCHQPTKTMYNQPTGVLESVCVSLGNISHYTKRRKRYLRLSVRLMFSHAAAGNFRTTRRPLIWRHSQFYTHTQRRPIRPHSFLIMKAPAIIIRSIHTQPRHSRLCERAKTKRLLFCQWHDFHFFVGLKREIAIIWDKNFMVCCGVALITEAPTSNVLP